MANRTANSAAKATPRLAAGGARRFYVADGGHRPPLNRLMILLCVLLLTAGCNNSQSPSKNEPTLQPQNQARRIVSLSPSVTEILDGVGAFPRVVAVSDYCEYPPGVKSLPRVGGWQNTNLERLASLKPDLVIMTDAEAPFVKDRLEGLKIPTLVVPSRSIEDAFVAMRDIGRATDNVREAERLAVGTRAEIDGVRALIKDLPKRRVLCVVDRVPGTLRDLYTATEGSFIAQLVEIAGGESVAPPAEKGYGKINKEAIVALDPEIIIDMVQGAEGKFAEDPRAVWNELPQLRAVREGRVYPLRETSVLHPSQFIGKSALRFARIIHADVLGGGGGRSIPAEENATPEDEKK
jgi:iron complex transport system substrate-binding protein